MNTYKDIEAAARITPDMTMDERIAATNAVREAGHRPSDAQIHTFQEIHRCEGNVAQYSSIIEQYGEHPTSVSSLSYYRERLNRMLNNLTLTEMRMFGDFRRH